MSASVCQYLRPWVNGIGRQITFRIVYFDICIFYHMCKVFVVANL